MTSAHRLPLDSIRALVQCQILDASGGVLIALNLFGSLAEGREHPESDVDRIDLSRASTVVRAHVVGDGHRVRAGEFEMYALSDYARLNQEHRIVIDSLKGIYRDGGRRAEQGRHDRAVSHSIPTWPGVSAGWSAFGTSPCMTTRSLAGRS